MKRGVNRSFERNKIVPNFVMDMSCDCKIPYHKLSRTFTDNLDTVQLPKIIIKDNRFVDVTYIRLIYTDLFEDQQ